MSKVPHKSRPTTQHNQNDPGYACYKTLVLFITPAMSDCRLSYSEVFSYLRMIWHARVSTVRSFPGSDARRVGPKGAFHAVVACLCGLLLVGGSCFVNVLEALVLGIIVMSSLLVLTLFRLELPVVQTTSYLKIPT